MSGQDRIEIVSLLFPLPTRLRVRRLSQTVSQKTPFAPTATKGRDLGRVRHKPGDAASGISKTCGDVYTNGVAVHRVAVQQALGSPSARRMLARPSPV